MCEVYLRVAQLVIRMSVGHEFLLLVGNALCHWVGEVDSDDKSKRVLWVLGYLMW